MIAPPTARVSLLDLIQPDAPLPGSLTPVAESVLWLRLQLPFRLNHINLWLIREKNGWALIDTGLGNDATQAILGNLVAQQIQPAQLSRVIVTHYHPDHIGNAGWLTRTYGIPFHAPFAEWSYGRMISLLDEATYTSTLLHFYRRFGLNEADVQRMLQYGNHYARHVTPLPDRLHRLLPGGQLQLDSSAWQVISCGGHSPEHACLYNESDNILIAGDQVLPFISPNISVSFFEPDSDPLRLYLASLKALRQLPPRTLVLPSHGIPFRNLHVRLDQLADHHEQRLSQVLEACRPAPQTAAGLMRVLFPQELDTHQIMFALGEAAAHANHLAAQGNLRTYEDGGVLFFSV